MAENCDILILRTINFVSPPPRVGEFRQLLVVTMDPWWLYGEYGWHVCNVEWVHRWLHPPGSPIMEALGRYFAEFAALEFAMLTVLSHALGHGDNNEVAGAILKRVRSLADRIEMLRDVAVARQFGDNIVDAVNALCDTFSEINARRNTYAHGTYGPDEDGGIRLKTYVFSPSRSRMSKHSHWNGSKKTSTR